MVLLGFSRSSGSLLKRVPSLAIRIFQGWTPFSHVYIRYYDIFYREWLVLEASHGTVHLIRWDNWVQGNQTVLEIEIEMSKDRLNQFVKYAYSKLQVKYSKLNIIGIFLKRVTGIKFFNDGNKAFICSELAARAFEDKIDFKKDLDYVTPLDVYNAVSRM